jgi:hypothetical protein
LAAVGLAFFYFLFRSQNHPTDAVLYALAADVKDAYPFFHWHHLLYTPLTWLLLRGARSLGYAGDAFTTAAAFSAASAAAAAALFYLSLRRLGATVTAGLLAAAAAAFSASWWCFAGEMEILAMVALFLAGALYISTTARINYKTIFALACWLGLGTLCHQVVILFVLVCSIVVGWESNRRLARLAVFFSAYATIVIIPYVLIPSLYYHVPAWGERLRWVTYYFWWGEWGYLTRERLTRGYLTMLGAVAAGPTPFDAGKTLPPASLLQNYVPAILVFAGALGTVAAASRRLWREKRRWLVTAVVWFVFFHIFFSWWEPENAEWWIPTTMPLWLLFGLAVPQRRAFRVTAGCVLFALAFLNFNRLIYPATLPGKNEAEKGARVIVSVTKPGDAVLMAHVDANCWVDYLSRHTRTLPTPQPFCKPHPGAAEELEASASRGFPEYTADGRTLYFTDSEWDDPTLSGRAGVNDLRIVFFKMIRRAEPVTVLDFPGGESVFYRFTEYGGDIGDVQIFEAEAPGEIGERAVLASTGAAAKADVVISKAGRYVLCVQASGMPAEGVWPVMEVAVDGVRRGVATVDATFWRFYEMEYELGAGVHEVKVTFCNDYCDPESGKNRDLYVNRIIIYRREPCYVNYGSREKQRIR